MRTALFLALFPLLALPALAGAASVEIAGFAGYTFPFYSQSFSYDPGPVEVPIPGVSIEQSGSFELKASGGAAFAGAVTLYVTNSFGFEIRLDSADVTIDTKSAGYTVRAGLPSPLAPVVANLSLTKGTADVKALTPFSLNLKLQTPGRVKLFLSGGASHLGNIEASLSQTVGLGVVAVDLATGNLNVATIGLEASSSGQGQSAWGGNLGLGLRIPLGSKGGLLLEGRGFYFPKRTIEWQPVIETPLPPLQELLLERVRQNLPSVEFEPWWVQATIGVAYRF
jgi:hypothetical protein